jgi:hypothetical protein
MRTCTISAVEDDATAAPPEDRPTFFRKARRAPAASP